MSTAFTFWNKYQKLLVPVLWWIIVSLIPVLYENRRFSWLKHLPHFKKFNYLTFCLSFFCLTFTLSYFLSLTFSKNIYKSFSIIIILSWCSKIKFIAMSIVFRGFLRERRDKVARKDFLPALKGNFLSQDVETRKGKTIYVSPVCADIIISKEHRITEVIP